MANRKFINLNQFPSPIQSPNDYNNNTHLLNNIFLQFNDEWLFFIPNLFHSLISAISSFFHSILSCLYVIPNFFHSLLSSLSNFLHSLFIIIPNLFHSLHYMITNLFHSLLSETTSLYHSLLSRLSEIPDLLHYLLAKFDEACPPETRAHILKVATPFVIAGFGVALLCLICYFYWPAIVSCMTWLSNALKKIVGGFFSLLKGICIKVYSICSCCTRNSCKMMMKAPGTGGKVMIPRSLFESNPASYFSNLRASNKLPLLLTRLAATSRRTPSLNQVRVVK